MKKAIVTGANGFIGSAICRELCLKGYETIAIVRNESSIIDSIRNLSGIRIEFCELSAIRRLPELLADRDVDLFFHLAWEGSAGPLRANPETQIQNIKHSCDAVYACNDLNCKRFVFASSIMEYEINALMAMEQTPGINTLYSSAKLAADYMARSIAGFLGVDFIRGIISNIYGPGETSPRLINTSIRKMLRGEHCSFSAGEQIYDFIYIDDAAKMFVLLGQKGKRNKPYYIGSLNPRPLKEFLLLLRDCVDSSIEIGLGELPYNGPFLCYNEFDLHAVKNDTGFEPEVSFENGIQKTISWMKGER